MEENKVVPLAPVATVKNKFVVGIDVSHTYSVTVNAVDGDAALMAVDDWLRGNTPANTFAPEIISSELNVIGIGHQTEAGIKEVSGLRKETQKTLVSRGPIPDQGCVHLFPAPPDASLAIPVGGTH